MITDFLKPSVRSVKLASPVAPFIGFTNYERQNLDLNTTARKKQKKIQVLSNYLDLGSRLVVTWDLAYDIGKKTSKDAKSKKDAIPKISGLQKPDKKGAD